MRHKLLYLIITLLPLQISALENLEIKTNEQSHYVYMRFYGYHAHFNKNLSIFLKELENQNIHEILEGEPFNIYFSEHDWAIACLVDRQTNTSLPLRIGYFKNSHIASCLYDGKNQNLDDLLMLMSSFFEKKGYKWNGPLILKQQKDDLSQKKHEVIVPISRDLFQIWKKPKGAIKVAVVFVCLVMAIFLFTYKKGRKKSNIILGIFALICFLQNSNSFLWIYAINEKWPHLYNFSMPFNFLFGPLLFFYTKSIIQSKYSFKKIEALHLIPFFIIAITYFFVFQVHDAETKFEILKSGFKDSLLIEISNNLYHIHVMSYLILSIIYLLIKKAGITKVNPSLMQNVLTTLKILLIGLMILQIINIIEKYISLPIKNYWLYLSILGSVCNLVFVSVIVVRSLKYPEIFSFNINGNNDRKYNKSPLNEEHKEYYLRKLQTYMENAKPYLSSAISLTSLAKETSIPARYLSQVLNEKLKLSFYDFINKYRISEVTNMLTNPEHMDSSIINIAFDCGFNSKSVFNTSFKKITGLTPKEYREIYLSTVNSEV